VGGERGKRKFNSPVSSKKKGKWLKAPQKRETTPPELTGTKMHNSRIREKNGFRKIEKTLRLIKVRGKLGDQLATNGVKCPRGVSTKIGVPSNILTTHVERE